MEHIKEKCGFAGRSEQHSLTATANEHASVAIAGQDI